MIVDIELADTRVPRSADSHARPPPRPASSAMSTAVADRRRNEAALERHDWVGRSAQTVGRLSVAAGAFSTLRTCDS